MNLFNSTAPWVQASNHVEVFKFYNEWVAQHATSAQLKQAVDDLNRRGIAIALEVPPLTQTSTCGQGVEGFASSAVDYTVTGLERIGLAGGSVAFLDMDEPFYFAKFYTGSGACNWSTETVARQVSSYIGTIKASYPGIFVGDIEPLVSGIPATEYENWIDVFHAVSGSNFPWLQVDTDWGRTDWPDAAKALQTYTQARGINFGMLYFGDYNDNADAQWIGKAEQRFVTFEAEYGGRPDQAVFQSWEAHPQYVLPETNNNTFTHLILSYFRTRTSLSMTTAQAPGGSLTAGGTLLDASGRPMGSVHLSFFVTALNGSGIYATYRLSGLVPSAAATAVVGVRLNTECGCSGNGNLSIYRVTYSQGNAGANLVPNPDFANGLQYWGHWGNGTVVVKPSDHGSGNMLDVWAGPKQSVGINSGQFLVTPGSNYTFTIAARVSPTSLGTGYVAVIFLSGSSESRRDTLPISAPTVQVGDVVTGQDGTFSANFQLQGMPRNTELQLEAIYPGDGTYWPAYARGLVGT